MARRINNRKRGYTRISRQHQVTLPADAMAAAGLVEGERLSAASPGPGKILLEREVDVVDAIAGDLTGVFEPCDLDRLRDEWE